MKVKRLERDSTGCVKHIQLDLGWCLTSLATW
jgi:hypothetical protein